MAIRKTGSGPILRDDEEQPVTKTATAKPLTPEDVRKIETEDE